MVLYLLLGLVALDGAIAARTDLWESYDPQFARDRVKYARNRDWDVVVAGGSPSMCVDSRSLKGLKWNGHRLEQTLNLGIPFATTTDIYYAIERGLNKPPALLVYAIAATDLNEARIESMSPEWFLERRDIQRWTAAHPRNTEFCVRHYLLERAAHACALEYHRAGIRRWAAERAERFWPGFCPAAAQEAHERSDDAGGLREGADFLPSSHVRPRDRYSMRRMIDLSAHHFGPMENYNLAGHVAYLNSIVDWAEQHHTPLLLANIPVTEDLEREYPGAFAAYRTLLLDLQKQRGVSVLLATREQVGLRDADYIDPLHLNGDGSSRYSQWLRHTVSALSDTTSPESDPSGRVVPASATSNRARSGPQGAGAS